MFVKLPIPFQSYDHSKEKWFVISKNQSVHINTDNIVSIIPQSGNKTKVFMCDVETGYLIHNMNPEQFVEYIEKQSHTKQFNLKMDQILK